MCSIPLGEFQQILKQHLILNTQLWSVALLMYIYRLEDRIGKSYCTMLHGISSYFVLSDRYEGPQGCMWPIRNYLEYEMLLMNLSLGAPKWGIERVGAPSDPNGAPVGHQTDSKAWWNCPGYPQPIYPTLCLIYPPALGTYLDIPIQDITSNFCGAYCVSFVLHVKDDFTYEQFIGHYYSDNLLQNDEILKQDFSKINFLVNMWKYVKIVCSLGVSNKNLKI